MNQKDEESLWSSFGSSLRPSSSHQDPPLDSLFPLTNEMSKLWNYAANPPTPPRSRSQSASSQLSWLGGGLSQDSVGSGFVGSDLGSTFRYSSASSDATDHHDLQSFTRSRTQTQASSIPNWAELAQGQLQHPRYLTGGSRNHMRNFTAPATGGGDPFSPFASGRSGSGGRSRTLSSPAIAHASYPYQAESYASRLHSSMSPPSSGASGNYSAGIQHTPSQSPAPGFRQNFDSPASSSPATRSTGKSFSGPSFGAGGGDINSHWNRRKSVEATVPHPSSHAGSFAYGQSSGTSSAKRPSFPSTPNRFVTRQLQQASRSNNQPSESIAFTGPSALRRNSKTAEPIGIFVWGFPDAIRVKDIIEAFSCFGDMLNVGIDIKNGIKFSFIDYESVYNVQEAFSRIPHSRYLGMKTPLQVRLRFDKISKPSFDNQGAPLSVSADKAYVVAVPAVLEMNDKRTLHLFNLPHNINKPEIEQVLSQIAPITRIKIFQRAAEKKSSVFVSFKTIDKARLAASFMKRNNLVFKDMKEPLMVEYPTQDISRHPPVFAVDPAAVPSLSKKARKLLAATNTIAYARSPDSFDADALRAALSVHGPCTVYIIRAEAPSTAFIKFQTPKACSEALAEKTCGVTLPRHKRVDVQQILGEDKVRDYLMGVADIKAITFTDTITTIEFLTAIGAAQVIVRFESVPFDGTIVRADYSPSLQVLDENGNPIPFPSEDGASNEALKEGLSDREPTDDHEYESLPSSPAIELAACGSDEE